jgi:hypothetical protein
LKYFYRFLRTHDDGGHQSELKNPIRFYIEGDCHNNRDFTQNTPIVDLQKVGNKAQVLFGMTEKNDVTYAYDFFGHQDRILARISLNYLITQFGLSLNVDQQMNTGFSKYLLGIYKGQHIVIPDEKVEVLSLSGWTSKGSNTYDLYKNNFKSINPSIYTPLLSRI